MKKTFTLLLLFFFTNLFAQEKFELGYYIDDSGNKVEGEISEIKISNFPSDFFFKKGGKTEKIVSNNVEKIQYGTDVFEKKQFQYDPSLRMNIANMPREKELQLVDKTAFLQLLVNGDYKLYKYTENGVSTFFYENANNELTILKYKKYLENGTEISENKEYLSQLEQNVQNKKALSEGYYNAVKYNENDLMDYFTKINGKSAKKERKSKVHFNIFGGYSIHTMDINFLSNIEGKSHQSLTIMPEVEYVLNNHLMNPTSFYFNAKLHNFKNNFVEKYERENWNHEVNYQSIYVSFGAKQYFLSSEKVKFYAKLGLALNSPIKYEIKSPVAAWLLHPVYLDRYSGGINTAVGVKLFDKVLVEVDYDYVFSTYFIKENRALNLKLGYSF